MKSKYDFIKEIVSDDDRIFDVIKQAPQTYNTILSTCKDDGTMQQILRRRIRRLLKQNRILKMRVPGTRFGLAMFCTDEHDYKVLVLYKSPSTHIYYMLDFTEDDTHITIKHYWELKGPNWSNWVYCEEPLIISKLSLRGGYFRLWE